MIQDLSLAGKKLGMSVSQSEGGTRSGLLWEVVRILDELKDHELPQILLMENVPEVVGSRNVKDFRKLVEHLDQLGYTSYFEILNAKDYGIPQNRKRCFMLSVLNGYGYTFPIKMKLKYRLKDFLEKQVDEKYYLSEKMINYITATGTKDFSINNSKINCSIGRPLTTEQNKRAGTTNYICDELPENADLRDYTGDIDNCEQVLDLNYYNHEQSNRVYGTNKCSPTIRTGFDDAKGIKIVEETRYGNIALNETLEQNNVEDGDFIDAYNRSVRKDIAGTITTRVSDSNDTFIAESNSASILIKNKTKQGYLEAKSGDGININSRMEQQRGNVQKESIPTLTTMGGNDIGVVVDENERK